MSSRNRKAASTSRRSKPEQAIGASKQASGRIIRNRVRLGK